MGKKQEDVDQHASTTRFALLVVCLLCQMATVAITWPLWELRETPPHLPMFGSVAIPFGFLMIGSLAVSTFKPRVGVVLHVVVLLLACVVDQFRTQPQFFALALYILALTFDPMARVARWWFPSLWLWAGIHKLISPYWWGITSYELMHRMEGDHSKEYLVFAAMVAASEIGIGLVSIFKPKWAAWGAPAMHGGIILFLSPLGIDWNYSVIPWNLATGVTAYWVLSQDWIVDSKRRTDRVIAIVMMVFPVGFYFALVDHGIASVLYSDSLPRAEMTYEDGHKKVTGWGELAVPFPSERRLHRKYFEQSAEPGDKMHIFDPRPLLDDIYLMMDADRNVVEITAKRFYREQPGEVMGIGYDDRLAMYRLTKHGAWLKRRVEKGPIFAIQFEPETFEPKQLAWLAGLPNLEQIQLEGTSVKDEDLKLLPQLYRLEGIGLSNTAITDEGLRYLEQYDNLSILETEGTKITPEGLRSLGIEK